MSLERSGRRDTTPTESPTTTICASNPIHPQQPCQEILGRILAHPIRHPLMPRQWTHHPISKSCVESDLRSSLPMPMSLAVPCRVLAVAVAVASEIGPDFSPGNTGPPRTKGLQPPGTSFLHTHPKPVILSEVEGRKSRQTKRHSKRTPHQIILIQLDGANALDCQLCGK